MPNQLERSDRWFRTLLRFFPEDFRDEMGTAFVETYRDRARAAAEHGGAAAVALVHLRALLDALRNGVAERLRPSVMWRRGGNWGRDTERAMRRIARSPVFTFSVVGTLAIGLGAFAVTTAVVNKVLLAPLPYRNPGDLYMAWRDYRAIFDLDRGWLGGPDVAAIAKTGGVIEDAAGLIGGSYTLTREAGGEPEQIDVMRTTPNFFPVLGVQPMLGRGFAPDEVGPERPAVIVLSYGLWQRLGGRDDIVGSQLRLSGTPFTVIGVMSREFSFSRRASLGAPEGADAYVPIEVILATRNPNAGSYTGIIRARPGSSPAQVKAAVAQVGVEIDRQYFNKRGLKLFAVGFKDDLIGPLRPALLVLGAAGGMLVLVLMANLGTLLLTRAARREKEFAVSRALGASASAVARATLLEGILLGVLGGTVAAVAAVWATKALASLAPADIPRREFIAMDWQTALLVVGVGALLGLIAATAPAIWATRSSLATLLGNTNVRGGGGHGTMRRTMVVLQVALSLVLLSAGGLVVRSFDRLLAAQPGFRADGVLTLFVPIPQSRVADTADVRALQDRLVAGMRAIPGVTSVSATTALPLSAGASQTGIQIAGAPGNTGQREHDRPLIDHMGVRPGYFETMGIRMLAGRDFTATGRLEAVVDRSLADYFFPNGNALGARFEFGAPDTLTIVGIVEQARLYDVSRDDRPQIYYRSDENISGTRSLYYALRTDGDASRLAGAVQRAVRNVDPQLAIAELRTMEQVTSASLSKQRITAVLIGGFAAGGLLLAAMGLFGVVAGAVSRRRHELAVRIALGASHNHVLRNVILEGAALVVIGLIVAAPAVYWAGRAMSGILVGVSPHDVPTLAGVAGVLALVTLLACYLPARRVLEIDPAHALREE
jgi:putative ABC transport system permease protein